MRSLTFGFLALVVAGPAVAKDLALHQRITPGGQSMAPYDAVEYLTPTQRITDGPYARTVIDAKAQTVLVLDKEEKTYWQVSFDSLRRQTEALGEARAKSIDPSSGAPVTLAPTGQTETIAGHPCEQNILQGGTPGGSVCVAKDVESPHDPDLWKDWWGLGTRLGPLVKVTDALGAKRVSLRTIARVGKRNAGVTIEVTSIGEESPPAALTAIPPDYTQATRHSKER